LSFRQGQDLVLNAVEAMSAVEAGLRELLISTEKIQENEVLVAVHDAVASDFLSK
jgi:hypothetical protein